MVRRTECGGGARVSARWCWVMALGVLAVWGCDFRGAGGGEARQDVMRGLSSGREVARYSFDQALEPEVWDNTGGEAWKVVEGQVLSEGTRNKSLWLRRPLPARVRVEFDGRSESPDGDIKFEIFGDGHTHESGYIMIFGGWKNSINTIARLDEHGKDRVVGQAGWKVEPGRTYRMAVVRTDGQVRWFIDGEPFLTYDDANPLTGEEHAHFGFANWGVPLYFDNLVIFELE